MAEDQNLTPTTPPTIPDAQSAMTPAPDFSVVPGHQAHAPAPQASAPPDHPIWQRLKDAFSMPETEYSQKYAADDAAIRDKISGAMSHIVPLFKEATAAQPEIEKTKIGKQAGEFVQGQLTHPEQLAMAGGDEMFPEGIHVGPLKPASPIPSAHPEVRQPINFDAIAGHQEEPAPPMPSASATEADHEIQRLSAVLRDPHASTLEKEVAHQQITDYREMFGRPEVPGSLGAVAGPPVKPAAETPEWQKQAVDTEIQRLEGGLRQPEVGQEERRVANQQLKDYRGETQPSHQTANEQDPEEDHSWQAGHESEPAQNQDPKSVVESAGGTYRGKNSAGLVEITLPREMTDKLPIQDRFKDFVSVTMPEHEVNPEAVKAAMEKKFTEMGGKPAEDVPTHLGRLANEFQQREGRSPITEKKLQVDPRQEQMADAYAAAKHEPNHPEVKKSYDSFKKDIDRQYDILIENGYTVDAQPHDPYEGDQLGIAGEQSGAEKAYNALRKDVLDNKHISVWQGGAPPSDHPLSEVDGKTGLTYNEKLRAIHDIFGHVVPDNGFDAAGEESAWGVHNQMFSPESRPALATETRGQTAYVTKHGEFANQKATILPKEFHVRPEDLGQAESTENKSMPLWWNDQLHNELYGGKTKGGQLVEDAAKNGQFSVHPRTGDVPEGEQSEAFPENRVELNQPPTSKDIRDFVAKNRSIFNEDPELYVSGLNNTETGKYELKITKSPNADIPESQQEATPETGYHPHLQAIANQHGLTESPYGVDNGASFIAPDGKFVHLNSIEHGTALHGVSGSSDLVPFINDSGAIRTRVSFDRGGKTLHISVPKDGVTNEQISALKQAAQKAVGKNGNIVLERADVTAETKDQLSKTKEFGNANDIEHMLMDIEAHPENKWHAVAARRADKQSAGGIDPRTGKSDTEGHGTEIFPEKRQALDHKPTAQDFQDFYAANKDFFDAHPALKIGWDNESNVPGGHELNIGAVGKGAKKVAKKLEQRAAFDIGKGEVIPTGGEGLRTEFPNYSLEDRVRDLNSEPLSDTPGFESLSKDFHANMEPDERAYLKDNNLLQSNAMAQYHKIEPSVAETTNAMQAGAALGGWWQRYIDVFHGLADGGEQAAQKIGPSHAEVLKQWHAAVSGNKSVQDANNLAWHSYADWLEAGKPTGRKEIDDIVRKNGAQPEGSGKKGNAAISDTRGPRGKLITPGLDTTKLYNLINSPEMKGDRPFSGQVFNEETPNPLMGTTEGARKIPSMGATVAGKGNLNRLVIDAHIRDFYGHKQSHGPAAQYIADSVHLRQAAKALGLKGGEGQEQLWGTVLGLKTLLKEGLTPEEASGKLNADVINQIGKDYAEVIANDPEIHGILDRLQQLGVGKGSAGLSSTNLPARSAGAGTSEPGGSQETIDPAQLAKTASRIREQISPSKIKKPAVSKEKASGGWASLIAGTKPKYLPPK